jgi:pyridoxamine 5'-phosphate oxidase
MENPLRDLRAPYTGRALLESAADPNPLVLFQSWMAEALACADLREPNGMTLATSAEDGSPDARVVLLRGCDERGFVFFTSYDSRKAGQLRADPRGALVFWWAALERQVRVWGPIERVLSQESDAYFVKRPRGHKLSTWAAVQSAVIRDRAVLERRLTELEQEYPGDDVPRPPNWGGYRLIPAAYEFWQGRPDRLHDRLRYTRAPGGWAMERLAP